MIRRPPRSTLSSSSAASDVYKRQPLDAAAGRVGPGRALQGNLDPAVLFAPWGAVAAKAREVLAAGKAADGHIFNLGHGVLPDTDPGVLERLVEMVHAESA